MNSIQSTASLPQLPPMPSMPGLDDAAKQAAGAAGLTPFVDLLQNQVQEVNGLQIDADNMVHSMLTGESVDSAEVLSSVQKADMAFRLMQQIRNKLVDAYRELSQMQI